MNGVQPNDGSIVPSQNVIGIVFSIYGLVLVWPIAFVFKQYFRVLDNVQFMYLWGMVIFGCTWEFSDHLGYSWFSFMPSFLNDLCTAGDFVCTAGGQLSWTICFIGFLSILMLIVSIEKCRRDNLKAEPVYSFFKGILRWTYLPLFYYSVKFLLSEIVNGTITSSSGIGSIIVLAILIVFPIAQLIAYKCIQDPETDKIWYKWIEFWSYVRLACVSTTIAFYAQYGSQSLAPLYVVPAIFLVYGIIHLIGEDFEFKIMGRISYVIGECLIMALYCLFVWGFDATTGESYIIKYDLDLFIIAAIILIDMVYYIARIIRAIKNRKNDAVNPEEKSEEGLNKKDDPLNDQVLSPKNSPRKYDV